MFANEIERLIFQGGEVAIKLYDYLERDRDAWKKDCISRLDDLERECREHERTRAELKTANYRLRVFGYRPENAL